MTIRDIAELAGVSPAAVSIVLNGKKGVSEERRQKIQKIIDENGYQSVSRKKAGSQMILALSYIHSGILVEENQGFISLILSSMQTELKKRGYSLMQMNVSSDNDDFVNQANIPGIAGVCVIASEMPRSHYRELENMGYPFIVLDNLMPGYSYPCVGINNVENVRRVLEYCAERGIRQVGYLKSSIEAENFSERSEAFFRFTKELGIKVDQKNVYQLTPTLRGAHHDMRMILESGANLQECLFADNDMIALGAMTCLKEHGYHIPQDISILGFDDIPYSGVSSPTLTTINVRRDVIGRMAAKLLMDQIRQGEQIPAKIMISGQFKERKSVK